jgi:hypothetical protein
VRVFRVKIVVWIAKFSVDFPGFLHRNFEIAEGTPYFYKSHESRVWPLIFCIEILLKFLCSMSVFIRSFRTGLGEKFFSIICAKCLLIGDAPAVLFVGE